MISRVINNSAVNTKVLAMKRGGLSEKDYKIMSGLSSVSEAAEFLKNNTRYSALLKNTDTASVHRGMLEKLLRSQLQYDIKSLLSFSGSSAKFFLNIYTVKEEIYSIKIFLRYLLMGRIETFRRESYFTEKTFSRLKNVNSFDEFTEALANTDYYRVLKVFTEHPERQNLFEIEMTLDMFYKSLCQKYIKKYLSKEDAKSVERSFGIQTDLDTAMFILRAKKYYNFSSEQIYLYLNTAPYRLKLSEIKAMAEAKDSEEIIGILLTTPYKEVFSADTRFFENNVLRYNLKTHSSLYRKNPYSIEAILYYINIKEIEIKNITTLIDGIRYGL